LIRVKVKEKVPGRLSLAVEDDGVGLPEGVDGKSKGSLGLLLVDTLTQQLRGTLDVRRNRGTGFCLNFPVNEGGNTAHT
jgi:two-component sensor histidine kinase